jgi:hypothetical protein
MELHFGCVETDRFASGSRAKLISRHQKLRGFGAFPHGPRPANRVLESKSTQRCFTQIPELL